MMYKMDTEAKYQGVEIWKEVGLERVNGGITDQGFGLKE